MAEPGSQVPDVPAPQPPQFSGRPEEDEEAHLLQTNDWVNAHNFLEDIKVKRFCLTLVGEDRL